ncbi:MAG: 16S rRNA (cytosine(1402)-N(4))-methyltransferase [Candidatus Staskawiczbacteria bacterium RIFCSPHIGHO2_12_FULL_38_11]|uniref:Ribosomal RNA small subunit methyltransferase H n=1 Tax=Candidatus Staskawiczbacteria bacterium RIFCSPHIGHO2_12_FULL_38_11 TaxID=1802209 RepID=A0A1G2I3V2_9BACT|nr:MAG: 16S rRNA (cytosine(1402)-N(4))-methyltransferase [Candidatus Staskawiczbacteria bacterium RIFCSPHIGHO2_12_FULL_38_11]
MIHKPVLVKEVLEYLDPKPNENFIDGTIGQAGHAIEILKKNGPDGKVLGIDLDASQVENSKLSAIDAKERITLVNDSYANIKEIVEKISFKPVSGILLDLGYSSWHIENSNRGFSFTRNEMLDMRYDLHNTLTAAKIVNEYREDEIEKIIKDFGEEKFARQIAKEITKQRKVKKIESTFDLMDIIASAIPTFAKSKSQGLSAWAKAQVGAKTFQALRIAINGELDNLEKFLPQAIEVLDQGGRLVIMSFHSLEDRIVKNFFKNKEKENILKILTKKPIVAGLDEVNSNPRSRSAKLRAAIKI